MKHARLTRAIDRCRRAVRHYDPIATVHAECYPHDGDELYVCLTSVSRALAKRPRRETTIAGYAWTPSRAADLFVEGLRLVVLDKGLEWRGEP